MQGTAGVGWTETISLLFSHSYAGARRIARAVLQPTPAAGPRVTPFTFTYRGDAVEG